MVVTSDGGVCECVSGGSDGDECVGDGNDGGRCVSDCGACVRGGSYIDL